MKAKRISMQVDEKIIFLCMHVCQFGYDLHIFRKKYG